MRNINFQKIVNVITLAAVFAMVMVPTLALGQSNRGFVVPNATGGLPNDTSITDLILRIISILLAVAGLVAVVFLIVGGFRYITAGGNEEAAESGKKTIINAIIGIVVVILSFVIVRVISNALLNNSTQV